MQTPNKTPPSGLKLPTLSALRSVPPRKRWPGVISASIVEGKLASSDSSQDEIIIWMILSSKDGGLYNLKGSETRNGSLLWKLDKEIFPTTMNWRPTVEQTNKNIKKHSFEEKRGKVLGFLRVAITHSYVTQCSSLPAILSRDNAAFSPARPMTEPGTLRVANNHLQSC